MKKLILLLCLLVSVCAGAQTPGKHHVEAGAGLALPKDLLTKGLFDEDNSFDLYLGYRYNITDQIAAGAVYSFVWPHEARRIVDASTVQWITMINSLNAYAEYQLGPFAGGIGIFLGLGGGVQYTYQQCVSHNLSDLNYFHPSLYVHGGLEFMQHLRLTVSHSHFGYCPYFCINLGWAF